MFSKSNFSMMKKYFSSVFFFKFKSKLSGFQRTQPELLGVSEQETRPKVTTFGKKKLQLQYHEKKTIAINDRVIPVPIFAANCLLSLLILVHFLSEYS